jgi:molybdopterin molybdotransferase
MIGADEALALVLESARAHARSLTEVPAALATGLVLARAVTAERDYPPFDRATMDGYAVRLAHAGRTVEVRGEARPGRAATASVDDASCVEIMTGAPLPPGGEAVVMKEVVVRAAATATFPAVIAPGQSVVRAGAERRAGEVVVPEGTVLGPIACGLLATVGVRDVLAYAPPSLAVLVTGDEVVRGDARPGDVEIRDSNGPMLAAMARAAGVTRLEVRGVRDTEGALAAALEAARSFDVVVLTGGVSAGNYDLVPAALAAHGATTVFHKVRQQPGKPLLFATSGARLFFGLPGTPLGCHLGFHRYVSPAIRARSGQPVVASWGEARLAVAWSSPSDRQQFVLARVERTEHGWSARPLATKGSSDLFTPFDANAYINIPDGTRSLSPGESVSIEWLEGAR